MKPSAGESAGIAERYGKADLDVAGRNESRPNNFAMLGVRGGNKLEAATRLSDGIAESGPVGVAKIGNAREWSDEKSGGAADNGGSHAVAHDNIEDVAIVSGGCRRQRIRRIGRSSNRSKGGSARRGFIPLICQRQRRNGRDLIRGRCADVDVLGDGLSRDLQQNAVADGQ